MESKLGSYEVVGRRDNEKEMIMNPSRDLYDDLVDKIGELLFGIPECHSAYPYRTLIDAWLKQNGMGPEEIQRYFDTAVPKIPIGD